MYSHSDFIEHVHIGLASFKKGDADLPESITDRLDINPVEMTANGIFEIARHGLYGNDITVHQRALVLITDIYPWMEQPSGTTLKGGTWMGFIQFLQDLDDWTIAMILDVIQNFAPGEIPSNLSIPDWIYNYKL